MTRGVNADLNIVIRAQDQGTQKLKLTEKSLKALEKAQKDLEKTSRSVGIAGGILTAGLVAMTVAGEEQAATQRKLAVAIENTGKAASAVSPQAERMMSDLQALTGVSDELQRQALTNLIVALGDTDQAMAALPAVMDAAASSNLNLTEVSKTMGKALAGTVNTAESVGLVFDQTADFGERLAAVNAKVAGSAEAAATPSAKLRASLADIGDEVSMVLQPALEKAADFISSLVRGYQELDPAIQKTIVGALAFAGVFMGGVGLLSLLGKAKAAVTALQIALTAISGPIGWIVAALGATVGLGLVWALNEATEASDVLDDAQVGLAAQAPKTGAAMKKAGQDTEEAARRMEAASRLVAATTENVALAVADSLSERGLADSTESLRREVVKAFDLLPENAGRMVDNAGRYITSFENELNTFEDRWARLTPAVQEALLEQSATLLEQLGVQEGDLRAHGDNIETIVWNAWLDADKATQSTVQGMRDGLADLFNGITADHQRAMSEGIAQPTIEMADTVESEMDRVDASITKVFMNLPEVLKTSLNSMSSVLESSFNSRILPYFNAIIEAMNLYATLPDAPEGFGSLPFIQPLSFPAYRRGTGFALGGPSIVNEAAGEIVTLPQGAGVLDAGGSTRLIEVLKSIRSTGGAGREVTIAGNVTVVANSPKAFLDELELLS